MMAPCTYCGERAMRPTHSADTCPDRAWALIGDGIEAAMKADPSKTVGEVVEMAVTWAQHFAEAREKEATGAASRRASV